MVRKTQTNRRSKKPTDAQKLPDIARQPTVSLVRPKLKTFWYKYVSPCLAHTLTSLFLCYVKMHHLFMYLGEEWPLILALLHAVGHKSLHGFGTALVKLAEVWRQETLADHKNYLNKNTKKHTSITSAIKHLCWYLAPSPMSFYWFMHLIMI